MNTRNFYEDYSSNHKVKIGSNRTFGIIIAIFFTLAFITPLLKGYSPRWWSLGVSLTFLSFSILVPQALRPLHLTWVNLGEFIRTKITTPFILVILFFGIFTPIGLLLKLMGKDLLNIKKK